VQQKDVLRWYKIGQQDKSLRDLLRASAKAIGIDLDATFEDEHKRRKWLEQQAVQLIQEFKQADAMKSYGEAPLPKD